MSKGATNWLIIILFVLALAVMTGYIDISGIGPAPAPGVTTTPSGIVCQSTVTPDLDRNGYDRDNPTSAVTDNGVYRKLAPEKSKTWTVVAQGTAITGLEPFATYEFAPGVHTTVASGYSLGFGEYDTVTIQCKENTVMEIPMCNDEGYGTVTAAWFDADDTASTGEDYNAGDVQTVRTRWKATKDTCFGNPYIESYPLSDNGNHRRKYPNILCLKLNSTAWDEPEEVYLGDGTVMRRVGAPTIATADSAATHIMYCYEAPVLVDTPIDIYLTLDADNTYEPFVDDNAYYYAGHVYIDTDTGELGWGVENNDAAYTAGGGDADELTLDFSP